MSQRNTVATNSIHPIPLIKLMLIGAGIALIPITLFLITAGEPNPSWPKLYFIRPLIIVPIAGAGGGFFYYLMDYLRYEGGWKKAVANVLSFIAFIIAVFLGIVLGLDGTYWN